MKFLTVFIALLLLTGCSGLLPKGKPPAALYTLNAPPAGTADAEKQNEKLNVALQVLLPQAVPGLETDKIALRRNEVQFDYYSGALWSGPLTAMLQALLVQSFDNSHQLASVSNDLVPLNKQYSLLTEIRDFQVEYREQKRQAHVQLVTKLIAADKNKIIATSFYDKTVPIEADNLQQIVLAFNTAYQQASTEMVEAILASLRQHPSVMPSLPGNL